MSIGRTLRSKAVASAVALALAASLAQPARAAETFPFQNPGLTLEARVSDVLGRLTLGEKISLLHQFQPAIPRLGLPAFKTGTEALHGIGWTNEDDPAKPGQVITAAGTVFPQAPGLAATWDPALIKRVGSVIGDEARGYNAARPGVWGTQLWAPVVNLLRDPRWGRNEEGYSEDPYLTGVLSTAIGRGMQGDDPKYLKTAPVLKHYLANNNEDDSPGRPGRRDTTSSDLRPRVEREYDQEAFRPAISADAVTGVMASYNLVNGRPTHVDSDIKTVVRSWTKKTLLNVSDAGAPNGLAEDWSNNFFNLDKGAAYSAVLKAGIDSYTVNDNNPATMKTAINDGLARGLITEADIDTAVRHILTVRTRLGHLDPDGGPYAKITPAVINMPAHRTLARKTAADAMVLLRNEGSALPLKTTGTTAVVGPLANTIYTDWYSGGLPYKVTALDGIKARTGAAPSSEGADRIALKDLASGKYLTAGAEGGPIAATGDAAGTNQQFDVFEWGAGVLTLRAVVNGKYLSRGNWSTINNNADQPKGWYVQEQFKLEAQTDGSVLLRYAGYETEESWFGPNVYVKAGDGGALTLVPKAEASKFGKDVVRSGVDEAVAAVKGADQAVVVVGSMPFINGREDHDRQDMGLAGSQVALVRAVKAANPKTTVVLQNSYPTTIGDWADEVPAVLWTTHAGAETGNALADVLFGDVNPAGRLAQTWYRSAGQLPDIMDYDIIKAGRTYLYFKGDPLYPFGHGLSYTSFRYGKPRLSAGSVSASGKVTVYVDVTNAGSRAGSEVVQLYTHQRRSRDEQPVKELRGFAKISLKPREKKTVALTIKAADLGHWDVTRGRFVVESSTHDVMVGSSSADVRGTAALTVRGETIPTRDLARTTRAIDFDDYEKADLLPETQLSGDAVGVTTGSWLRFSDAALNATTFTAKANGTGTIKIRLGSPGGRVIGTASVAAPGGPYAYTTVTAPLTGATGRQDVYLTFDGDLKLSAFSLGSS